MLQAWTYVLCLCSMSLFLVYTGQPVNKFLHQSFPCAQYVKLDQLTRKIRISFACFCVCFLTLYSPESDNSIIK